MISPELFKIMKESAWMIVLYYAGFDVKEVLMYMNCLPWCEASRIHERLGVQCEAFCFALVMMHRMMHQFLIVGSHRSEPSPPENNEGSSRVSESV